MDMRARKDGATVDWKINVIFTDRNHAHLTLPQPLAAAVKKNNVLDKYQKNAKQCKRATTNKQYKTKLLQTLRMLEL